MMAAIDQPLDDITTPEPIVDDLMSGPEGTDVKEMAIEPSAAAHDFVSVENKEENDKITGAADDSISLPTADTAASGAVVDLIGFEPPTSQSTTTDSSIDFVAAESTNAVATDDKSDTAAAAACDGVTKLDESSIKMVVDTKESNRFSEESADEEVIANDLIADQPTDSSNENDIAITENDNLTKEDEPKSDDNVESVTVSGANKSPEESKDEKLIANDLIADQPAESSNESGVKTIENEMLITEDEPKSDENVESVTISGENVLDIHNVPFQNATTEEEAEWLSMGLGLADALRQIIALTDERDAALAMCQEKEEQPDINAQYDSLLAEVQNSLQGEMERRAESDAEVRKLKDEIQKYEEQLAKYSTLEDDFEQAQANLVMVVSEKTKLETEIVKLREFKDESEQKEVLLSSRLNEAKKKEANRSTAAGRLEAENETLKEDLEKVKAELNAMTQAKAKVESNMEKLKAKAVERVKQAETALAEERELNEERKRKMKTFVESKADELREAKESASDMQIELQETRTSLRSSRDREESIQKELEASRIKYRELQRDMERLKRSQQEMHQMGSTLEHELEKSASETEEHKKKRLTAKHELMTIVRTLEVEKAVSGKLRESIKFTFTPKALSQQQLLTECLKDFEVELERLATKLGKTLSLPQQDGDHPEAAEATNNTDSPNVNGSSKKGKKSRAGKADTDTERLITNLEHETQHVSKGIMSLAGSIERMRSLLNEDHAFNCMAYFSNVLAAVGHQEARHQRLGDSAENDDREETVSITNFDQGSSTM